MAKPETEVKATLTVYAARVAPDQLASLLTKLHSARDDGTGHFSYILVADWREVLFDPYPPKRITAEELAGKLPRSDSGRAFGECAELRWRRDEKEFICRWIFEGGKPPCSGHNELTDTYEQRDRTYLLWGEWLAEAHCWYTAQIPRRLEYPIAPPAEAADKTPLVLRVREYGQKGQVVWERFVRLERYDEKEAH